LKQWHTALAAIRMLREKAVLPRVLLLQAISAVLAPLLAMQLLSTPCYSSSILINLPSASSFTLKLHSVKHLNWLSL
jgi:hypothetical protein